MCVYGMRGSSSSLAFRVLNTFFWNICTILVINISHLDKLRTFLDLDTYAVAFLDDFKVYLTTILFITCFAKLTIKTTLVFFFSSS